MDTVLPTTLMKIFDTLGSGYKEHIYQRAIEIEFQSENILFHSEVICPVNYNGIQVGFERADIVTYSDGLPSSVLELKSQTNSITKKEFIQLYKYLLNLKVQTGYIINFIITHDTIVNNTESKYRFLELYKIEFENFKLYKYSFKNLEYKEYSL